MALWEYGLSITDGKILIDNYGHDLLYFFRRIPALSERREIRKQLLEFETVSHATNISSKKAVVNMQRWAKSKRDRFEKLGEKEEKLTLFEKLKKNKGPLTLFDKIRRRKK